MWSPDGSGVVFVAWPHAPLNFPSTKRRLGIVFCYNRPCCLMYLPYSPPPPPVGNGDTAAAPAAAAKQEAEPDAVDLTSDTLLSAFAPVFSPGGGALAFLSQDAAARSGVHSGTCSLHVLDWPAKVGVLVRALVPTRTVCQMPCKRLLA